MILQEEIEQLIHEFEFILNPNLKKNYLPILRNAFVPYLICEFEKQNINSSYLFDRVLTCEHIINAGVFYVDNTKKVTDIAAVKKYLTAVGEFCRKIIYKKYPTSILKSIEDFQSLCDEIVNRARKDLRAKSSHSHLSNDDYSKLSNYLRLLEDSQYKQQVIIAVFRLILLYGFKIGIIAAIKKSEYDEQKNTLKISMVNQDESFIIELPYLLSRQIEKINKNNAFKSEYLFLSENGQVLTSDYFDYFLNNISKEIKSSKKITTTSLSKYAVINMFLEGINPITISQISGMKDVNLKYCQQVAYDRTRNNTNRYINARIRNINTYDDFNF